MPDLGTLALHRAHLSLQALYKLGVKYFCLAPGSRSTPFALALDHLPSDCQCVHFDERGLGFHALGFAKASRSPAVLIVTTGTAVANLFPSVAEASLANIPLIILSADRPQELRDCGSNQTMDQVNLFRPFTRWEIDLCLSDPLIPDRYILSSLTYAFFRSLHTIKGPVQINCMIREPSFSNISPPSSFPSPCIYEPQEASPPLSSFEKWGSLLSGYQKGILLLGSDALEEEITPVLDLAQRLDFPIFSDILSGGRKIGDHPLHIEHADILLKTFPDNDADVVLQIGSRIVSKTITNWLGKIKAPHFLVTDNETRHDPFSSVHYKMECKTSTFCNNLLTYLPKKESHESSIWKSQSMFIKHELEQFFLQEQEFSEPSIVHFFKNHSCFFLSNSLPIRDADLFLFSKQGTDFVAANRGISGIDGNIATATGIAKALKKPLIALLGDIATLHDLNSFALVKDSTVPITFVILNNQGGGIFSFLPIGKQEKVCDRLFSTEHSYDFEGIAKTFSLPFFTASSLKDLATAYQLGKNTSCIIECKTNRKNNVLHHEKIYQTIAKKACCFINPSETLATLP